VAELKRPPWPTRDSEREQRIRDEIVVDCYGPEEQAMGWYYYLENQLRVPFTAVCVARRAVSPLHVGDEVEVIGMAPEEECEHEMFVLMRWEKDGLAVPLVQLEAVVADEEATQAVEDLHYWVRMGYRY
jgi:hypothetical protein